MDNWDYTSCSGNNAYVEEFIEGKTITEFSVSLVSMNNLPVVNVLYDSDKEKGTTIFLEHNNTIYMGKDMEYPVANPIQLENNVIRVDLCPK